MMQEAETHDWPRVLFSMAAIFSDLVDEFVSSCRARAHILQNYPVDDRSMRLSTWFIAGLSAAYIVDMLYFGGAYGMAAVSVFRNVGLGILAGLGRYV
jgi:hypothetical protein